MWVFTPRDVTKVLAVIATSVVIRLFSCIVAVLRPWRTGPLFHLQTELAQAPASARSGGFDHLHILRRAQPGPARYAGAGCYESSTASVGVHTFRPSESLIVIMPHKTLQNSSRERDRPFGL